MSDLLLNSLKNFYSKDNNYEELCSILNNDEEVSLRLIDWFVTNFSKKNNIIYLVSKTEKRIVETMDDKEGIVQINVFQEYKSQLKAFSKKKFDPFCRRERIVFSCTEEAINTTVGQLNFFRWAITNRVLNYIKEHKEIIEDDMNLSLKCTKDTGKKNKNGRKSRQELSKSALRGLNKNKLSVCITFD
tara:strand:- start:671 stop:1234 length:564 start_codon:yes stop_codon:yes gene_type:complete